MVVQKAPPVSFSNYSFKAEVLSDGCAQIGLDKSCQFPTYVLLQWDLSICTALKASKVVNNILKSASSNCMVTISSMLLFNLTLALTLNATVFWQVEANACIGIRIESPLLISWKNDEPPPHLLIFVSDLRSQITDQYKGSWSWRANPYNECTSLLHWCHNWNTDYG